MKDNKQQNGYSPTQFKMNLGYIENILYKYHKISETLNSKKQPDRYPTFLEEVERIGENEDAQINILKDVVTNQFVKFDADNSPKQVLEVINLDNLNSTERIAVQTLAVIVYQYCIHDYSITLLAIAEKTCRTKKQMITMKFFLGVLIIY